MRAVFLATKQPTSAIEKLTATLQSGGALIRHVTAWSGPGDLGRRHSAAACNADPFLLGAGTSLEAHLAECYSGEGLLLVSIDLGQQLLPRSGVVLLLWQPQVPHDVVQACAALPPGLVEAGSIRGLLLLDASPSLTQSVIHKALEGAGLQVLARKPAVMASRTAQAPQAAVQALIQLAEPLPPAPVARAPPDLPIVPGGVRIAVARDDAFSPCFHENLAVLRQAGCQLLFFSLLYDTSIPAGATCLYLSSGPLEAERWQQLANNRALLAAVRAFCQAGGLVLAEGAGLLYLSRTVDLDEDDGVRKHRIHEMAGVLPFKAHLLSEPQTAAVELHVTAGNPLMPAGCRPRGYLCSQANIVVVEERPLQSLPLGLPSRSPVQTAKSSITAFSTTYEVSVVLPQQEQQQQQGRQAHATDCTDTKSSAHTPVESPLPEGYAVHNVLASSCFLYLPSDPNLAAYMLRRSACIDAAALAASMAQHLGCSIVPSSKAHFQVALASVAGSRAGSRRQSIHDVSALAAAYGSNNGGNSACSGTGMLGCSAGCGSGANHHLPCSHQQHYYHHHHHTAVPVSPPPCTAPSPSCMASGCGIQCPPSPLQSTNSPQSSSTNAIASSLFPADVGSSTCGYAAMLAPLTQGGKRAPYSAAMDASSHSYRPHGLPAAHASRSSMAPAGWRASHDSTAAPAGLLRQQQGACGILAYGSAASLSPCSTASAVAHSTRPRLPAAEQLDAPAGPVASSVADHSARWAEATCTNGRASCGDQRPMALERSSSSCSYVTLAPGPTATAARGQGAMPHAASTPAFGAADAQHHHGLLRPRGHEDLGPVPAGYGGPGGCEYGWNANTPGPAGLGWPLGASPTATRTHGPVGLVGALGGAVAAVQGGVVCCAPGACEALVAMGMANRLAGIGSDCDHPPDVCTSRRVVFRWVALDEVPHGSAARGIRVIWPCSSGGGVAANSAGAGGGLQTPVGGGGARSSRASGDRCGSSQQGRVLLVEELALRQASPCVFVLPDMAELAHAERVQLEQALADMGLVDSPGGPCCILYATCRTLVDVMDLLLEVGSMAGDPQAASVFLERLQTRLRRIATAAAAVGAARGGGGAPSPIVSLPSSVPTPPSTARTPRVLILQSLNPLVEPGRWVPEMLAMVGASACLALPGGNDVQLSWEDVRGRAAPDVIIILTPPADSVGRAAGPGPSCTPSAGSGSRQQHQQQPVRDDRLHEQLAVLAAQPGWWCLPAVRVSQVYLVQSSLFVRPGPRLVDGAELLARLLVPTHYSSSRKVAAGAVMRLSLAAGQRCRATLLPSYFVPMSFS